LYETAYIPSSGWIHWDSFSLQQAVGENEGGDLIYGIETRHLGVAALAIGLDALNDTAKLLNDHFNLKQMAHLRKLHEDHQALLKESFDATKNIANNNYSLIELI